MNVALFALLALVAPPSQPTDSFRFEIKPDAGASYRYRNTLKSSVQIGGQSGTFTRDLTQELDVLRRDKYGFEIVMSTQSARLTFPATLKTENANAKKIGNEMAEKLVIGAIFQADGQLKGYVSYTDGDHQKTADDMAKTSFWFVLMEKRKGAMKVGDAYTAPIDLGAATATLAKMSMAIDTTGPAPQQVWTLKSFERKGGRKEAHFVCRVNGTLRVVGLDGAKPAIDGMAMKSNATAVFDVRTGMLVSHNATLKMTAEGGRGEAIDIAVTVDTALLNPSALSAPPGKR